MVYSRAGCHLCDEMLADLQSWIAAGRIHVTIVDVDSSPQLKSLYGERVPVLAGDGQEICHYFLDPHRLNRYLDGI